MRRAVQNKLFLEFTKKLVGPMKLGNAPHQHPHEHLDILEWCLSVAIFGLGNVKFGLIRELDLVSRSVIYPG